MTGDSPTGRTRTGGSAVTDPTARDFLRQTTQPWRPYRSLAVSYLFAAEFDDGA
jgi:3-methyladenine DNA glycosylase/8-oxoguanine DNA glycosylase